MRHLSRSLLLVIMTLALIVSGHGGHALVPGMGSMMVTAPAVSAAYDDHHGHAGDGMVDVTMEATSHGTDDPDHQRHPAGDSCASVSCGIVMLDSLSVSPRTSGMRPLSHDILTGQVPVGLSPALPERPPRS